MLPEMHIVHESCTVNHEREKWGGTGDFSRNVGNLLSFIPHEPRFTVSYRDARQRSIEDNARCSILIRAVSQLLSGFAELHLRT